MTNRIIPKALTQNVLLFTFILIILGVASGCGDVSSPAAVPQERGIKAPVIPVEQDVRGVDDELDERAAFPVFVRHTQSQGAGTALGLTQGKVARETDENPVPPVSTPTPEPDEENVGELTPVEDEDSFPPAPSPTQEMGEEDEDEQPEGAPSPAISGDVHYGPSSLEERVNLADIVARVGLVDAAPVAVRIQTPFRGTQYSPGILYTFNVLEYLKGSGDDEISAVVYAYDRNPDEAWALEVAEIHIQTHYDKRWKFVQSVVFLEEDAVELNGLLVSHQYQFLIAGTGVSPLGNFHIDSEYNKVWLPAAYDDRPDSQIGDGIEFLLDDPANYESMLKVPTITLDELRGFVEDEQEFHAPSIAEHGNRLYKKCLRTKYDAQRFFADRGPRRFDVPDVPSGAPADTHILRVDNWGRKPKPEDGSADFKDFLHGEDAHLFTAEPVIWYTKRPLPEGLYRFEWWGYVEFADEEPYLHACGADTPEANRGADVSVDVVAPAGTVHEALFDPQDIDGQGAGVGSGKGFLSADKFIIEDDGEITLNRLEWSAGNVEIELEPHNRLPDHHIDFIALDGSVSLRLDFDDAVEVQDEDEAQALSWGVCERAWQDGDLLMIRISESSSDLTGSTNDAECAATP